MSKCKKYVESYTLCGMERCENCFGYKSDHLIEQIMKITKELKALLQKVEYLTGFKPTKKSLIKAYASYLEGDSSVSIGDAWIIDNKAGWVGDEHSEVVGDLLVKASKIL